MTRDEALKKMQAVKSYMTSGNPIWSVTEIGEAFDMAIEALEQPERKVGKWIEVENKWGGLEIICSECGAKIPRDEWGNAMQSSYCYRCGVRMRGEEAVTAVQYTIERTADPRIHTRENDNES